MQNLRGLKACVCQVWEQRVRTARADPLCFDDIRTRYLFQRSDDAIYACRVAFPDPVELCLL